MVHIYLEGVKRARSARFASSQNLLTCPTEKESTQNVAAISPS